MVQKLRECYNSQCHDRGCSVHIPFFLRELLTNIGEFDSAKLSKISTEEKSNLPDLEDIQQEKAHQQLLESVETFPVDSLKHVEEIKVRKTNSYSI